MATYPLNKERINYSRLCRAIVDVCTNEFRDILVLQRRLNPKDLETELKKCADFSRFKPQELTDINTAVETGSYKGFDITMLYQIFRVLFTQDLRDDLMSTVTPSQICASVQNCSALSTGPATKLTPAETKALNRAVTKNSYDELEDYLLWKLYSQLCLTSSSTILIHPTKLWGKNPAAGALTLGDDIERIRILRNTVYGHITTTEVNDVEFNWHWTSLENIAIRIDSKIGTGYKKSLDDIKISSLDLEAEKKFSDQLKKLAEDLEQNVSNITTLKERQLQLTGDISSLKTENTLVNTRVDKFTSELHTLRMEQEEVATGVKTEIATVREEQETMTAKMKTDIATCREELGAIAADIEAKIASVRADQEVMTTDLKRKITTVKWEQGAMAADIKTDMDTVKYNLHHSVKQITTRLQRDEGQLKSSFKDPVPEPLRRSYRKAVGSGALAGAALGGVCGVFVVEAADPVPEHLRRKEKREKEEERARIQKEIEQNEKQQEKEKREIEEERERILKLLIEEGEERRQIEKQLQLKEENDRKKEKEKREKNKEKEQLQKEIERMQKEKERMQKEKERMQKEKERMQKEKEQNEKEQGSYAKAIGSGALTGAARGITFGGPVAAVGGAVAGATIASVSKIFS